MFRRSPEADKENNLFNTNDAAPAAPQAEESTATTTAAAAPAVNTASQTQAYTPASSFSAPNAPSAGPITRPVSEPRQNPSQAPSAFRSMGAPIGADRNRLPDVKAANTAAGSAAVAEKSNKSGRRVLTVGNDILLKGEIATCDRLVIEGKVDASLNDVHTVEISETGSFKGSANIEDAEISGLFEGDLVVRNRLVIYATGKVRGKISYGEIEIERGGELTGEIKTTSPVLPDARGTRTTEKKDDKVAA